MSIELHSWPTPNGLKISIFLAEAELEHRIVPVNIGKGDQFAPSFLKFSPNNRIPAIIDNAPTDGGEPIGIFESGAILWYLAEKTQRFGGNNVRQKAEISQWLMWQVGGLGPMLGQRGHFTRYAPDKIPYAIDRYEREAKRLFGVLNKQLEGREFVAGEYSIADMAIYPWVEAMPDHVEFPNIQAWVERIKARPAVQAAYATKAVYGHDPAAPLSDEAKKLLFGIQPSTTPVAKV